MRGREWVHNIARPLRYERAEQRGLVLRVQIHQNLRERPEVRDAHRPHRQLLAHPTPTRHDGPVQGQGVVVRYVRHVEEEEKVVDGHFKRLGVDGRGAVTLYRRPFDDWLGGYSVCD